MKRLLLGVAIAAFSTPVLAQIHEVPKKQIIVAEGDEILTVLILEPDENGEIVAIGQRIGASDIDTLTSPTSVMTSQDIAARGQQYISELLRSLPGIAVSTSGPGGGITQIRVRGSEANHVLVLIDGVEVANPSTGEFDFSGLRAQDVERIEVLRGEQSALYGSDAIGGVINIITRAGSTREGWRANIEAGSRETLEGQVSAVLPIGGASFSLNGNAFKTEGYDISGLGEEKDGSKSHSLNVGLNKVKIGEIELSAKYGTSELEVDFDEADFISGYLINTPGETTVKSNTARVDAQFDLGGLKHLITGHMVETDTDTRGGFDSRSIGRRRGINWAAKRSLGESSITALIEAEHEQYEISPNFTEVGANPDNWTYAIAGDYRYNNGPISLSASARHDINDIFDDATTWRLGAGYAFEDFGGRVRASVGTGVKNPSLIELFGFFPGSRFVGNPNLKPEESLGFNLGYDQEIGDFDLSVDYFHAKLKNEIFGFSPSPVNLEIDSKREGFEVEVRWQAASNLSIRGSATVSDSDREGIKEIRRPDFLASGTVTWEATDKLSFTAQADHNGKQLDNRFFFDSDFGLLGGFTSETLTLDAFTLVGGRASYDLNDRVTISLRGENLLDKEYQEVVGYTSPGRAVYGGLNLNF